MRLKPLKPLKPLKVCPGISVSTAGWYGSTLLNAIHARHHEEGPTATGWGILEKTTYADDGLSSEIGFACTCDEQYVVTVSTVIALAEKPKNLLMDWTKKDSPEWQEYPH